MSLALRKNPIDLPAGLAVALNLARTAQPFLFDFSTVTLAAGTATVSARPNVQANSLIFASYQTSGGATQGVKYKIVPTATGGGFVITAVDNTGATVATDTSTLVWFAVTPCYHADATALTSGDNRGLVEAVLQVTATNAVDLPTTLALAANIDAVYRQTLNDFTGFNGAQGGAHKVIDTTDVPANAIPVDLPTTLVYLNDVKAKFNVHIASTTYHYSADTSNTIATTNAVDLPTSQALANAIKVALNAHIAIAPAGASVKVIE